jgi:hypothetical protein
MRAITYDHKAAPWSRSNDLKGTRSLPSNDNSGNNFSRIPCRTRTKIMINQATLCLGLLNLQFMSVPWRWMKCFLPSSCVHRHVNKSPLCLSPYSSLQLAYWGKWQGQTFWNSWSWVFDLELWLYSKRRGSSLDFGNFIAEAEGQKSGFTWDLFTIHLQVQSIWWGMTDVVSPLM